jgi:hypothetical protein
VDVYEASKRIHSMPAIEPWLQSIKPHDSCDDPIALRKSRGKLVIVDLCGRSATREDRAALATCANFQPDPMQNGWHSSAALQTTQAIPCGRDPVRPGHHVCSSIDEALALHIDTDVGRLNGTDIGKHRFVIHGTIQ